MVTGRSNLVDLDLTLIHETDGAYLLSNGTNKAWVPKAAVEKNDDGTFTMPQALAEDKELV